MPLTKARQFTNGLFAVSLGKSLFQRVAGLVEQMRFSNLQLKLWGICLRRKKNRTQSNLATKEEMKQNSLALGKAETASEQ